jgi:hypothetical protein
MKKFKTIPISGPENHCLKNTKVMVLVLILLLTMSGSLFAQSTNDDIPVKAALLKQDFKMLRDSLEDLHAGLYTYKTKKQIDRLFDQCEAKLDQPMTLIQFYCLVRYVVSGIEDGHTSAFLPPAANKALIGQSGFFPVLIRFIGKKAYATCDNEGLTPGTEIIWVDHHPIDKLRKELFGYIPSDGSTQSGKYAEINDGDSPFFYLYKLVYGDKETFAITYKLPGSVKMEKQVKATLIKDIPCRPVPANVTQYLKLSYPSNAIAVLTMKTFLNHKLEVTHEDFRKFLQSSFQDLASKNITKLIIDVRDNGGGDDENGAFLTAYLTNRPFAYYASIETTKRNFAIKDHDQLAQQQPAENNFNGKVYILINGKCFSGTTDFCGIARQFSNVKFIGEETGGGYYGNTSGARTTLILPNSRVKVNIPLWKYKAAVPKAKYKDRGIIPDYSLTPTISDVLQKKDVQIELTLKLANIH